jgi:hypothetical protein
MNSVPPRGQSTLQSPWSNALSTALMKVGAAGRSRFVTHRATGYFRFLWVKACKRHSLMPLLRSIKSKHRQSSTEGYPYNRVAIESPIRPRILVVWDGSGIGPVFWRRLSDLPEAKGLLITRPRLRPRFWRAARRIMTHTEDHLLDLFSHSSRPWILRGLTSSSETK